MALKLVCDGDGCDLTEETATRFGRLDPVHYCAACRRIWDAYQDAERRKRVELITQFESWRRLELTALKRGGLARLPDEWGLAGVVPVPKPKPKPRKKRGRHAG